MIKIEKLVFNPLSTDCYVIYREGSGKCVCVDPGCCNVTESGVLDGFLSGRGLEPEAILLTHGHFDHIAGVSRLLASSPANTPVYLHPDDLPIVALQKVTAAKFRMETPDFEGITFREATDGMVFEAAGISFRVIHTPGHTPGGVCYLIEEASALLSGDTLFAGSIGRTDLEGGDYDALMASILGSLIQLPPETAVLPGHGGASTVGKEALTNPFLLPFNTGDGESGGLDPLSLHDDGLI